MIKALIDEFDYEYLDKENRTMLTMVKKHSNIPLEP